MRSPSFWWRPLRPAGRMLMPVAAVYGKVAATRLARPGRRALVPVICIGNLVAGGAGKTPMAMEVARRLEQLGRTPVFLTRGYGGRQAGPLLVDPDRHDAAEVGDEALLLAARRPTIVARDRVAGAELGARHGDVLVLDDGFQNPSLAKDLSILVVDGVQGIGNGAVIPAGPLRAPLQAQLARAQAIVVVGDGPGERLASASGLPVFRARFQTGTRSAACLREAPVLAFCGLGRPEKFFAFLRTLGIQLVETRSFGDHHQYTDRDAAALLSRADRLGARLVTTAKDGVRLAGSNALKALASASTIVEVDLVVEDGDALDELVGRCL